MKLDDINESLGCEMESEDYDSVGGLMIEKLDDRLPERGEQVTLEDGVILTAKRVSGNRVTEVIIKLSSETFRIWSPLQFCQWSLLWKMQL